MKNFRPMLACNQNVNLENIKYPKLASTKLDGIRCLFHPQLGMVTRSLKQIPNKQLQKKFRFMVTLAEAENRIYDGEIYAHDRTFQEITRACMTKDFSDEKTIKKLIGIAADERCINVTHYTAKLVDDMEFHCFEIISDLLQNVEFEYINNRISLLLYDKIVPVKQTFVNSADEIKLLFEKKLEEGYEGLILRDPGSPYKYGRSTLKEEYMLKVKPFETFDAHIIGVIQSTEVNPDAEKKTNELGRSVTSKKKDDRILIQKACAFTVEYNHHKVNVSLAMTDKEKEEVWLYRTNYIGRMIEYKGMLVGSKDVPRHPVFERFREDRE